MHYYGSFVLSPPPSRSVRIPPVNRRLLLQYYTLLGVKFRQSKSHIRESHFMLDLIQGDWWAFYRLGAHIELWHRRFLLHFTGVILKIIATSIRAIITSVFFPWSDHKSWITVNKFLTACGTTYELDLESYRPRPATAPSSFGSVEVRCWKEELSSEVASTELLPAEGCGLRSPSTTDTGETVDARPSFTLVWGFTWFLLKHWLAWDTTAPRSHAIC